MRNNKGFAFILALIILVGSFMFPVGKASAQLMGAPTIQRHEGLDRYATALSISEAGWESSDSVILATGEDFPDALSATPLAKQLDSPILLVGKTLDSILTSELKRLQVTKVFIVGGEGVISTSIQKELESKNLVVTRLAGNDRYETSIMIADYMKKNFSISSEAVIATGEGFPDALSIAPIAAIKAMPILLSTKTELPTLVKTYIEESKVTKTYVIGGTGVILDDVMQQLPAPERISGQDRYATNIAILNRFDQNLSFEKIFIATANDFPDALAGSALAPRTRSPILLNNTIPEQVSKDFVLSNISRISQAAVLGGTGVLSETAVQNLLLITPATEVLTSANNDLNDFRVVKLGDSIYYYDYELKGIFKANSSNPSVKTRLTSGEAHYLTVFGDYIYFIEAGYKTMSRVKTDGSDKSVVPVHLSYTPILLLSDLTIYNNRLYFNDHGAIYRADLDGSNVTRIYGREDGVLGSPRQFLIRNNQFYYVNMSNWEEITYRANTDGTEITQVTYTPSYDLNISGNWLYYTNTNDNYKIYRTRLDGELYPLQGSSYGEMLGIRYQKTELVSEYGAHGGLNVYGEWVYFANERDGRNLYKIKIDGTEMTKLNNRPTAYINITDGWIYYVSNAVVYRMKLDGTTEQKF
jgi:putative cell wall-binding protein